MAFFAGIFRRIGRRLRYLVTDPLEKENERLRAQIQIAKTELRQCIIDFNFISASGHHSEYASRRSKDLLSKLESLW
jgi:hypothetical protein